MSTLSAGEVSVTSMKQALRWGALGGALLVSFGGSLGALAKPSPLDPKVDEEIEGALPEIESARLSGKLPPLHARYLDRTDRAGKVLAAWTLSEDQEMWNALKALSSFGQPEPWGDVGQAAVYLRWKIWDQAGLGLQRAHAVAPGLAHAYVVEGDLARLQGNAAAAEAAYQKALALRPQDGFALDGLGALALAAGQAEVAEQRFSKAKEAYADDLIAARGLEDAKLARGDVPGALAALEDQERLASSDAQTWLRSGKLRLRQGDPSAAAKDFEVARKLGSSDPELLKLLSETYKSQGKGDEERRLLDDLIAQGAATAENYARRSALREETDLPGALADLRKAFDKVPNDPDLGLRLAALSVKAGALSDAIALYRRFVESKPEAKPALVALEEQVGLAKKPIKGNVGQINGALLTELNRLYRLLLKKQPSLAGTLKLRVSVNEQGTATDEEWIEDTTRSPELAANLLWNAHGAHYPALSARYVFKFTLAP